MFQHQFGTVEDYLHHRAPYLMVDRVVSMDDYHVVTEKQISDHEFFVTGHFPGSAVFPGAMMQEIATQSAGILIAAKYNPMETFNTHDPFANEYALGVLVRIHSAKFRSFARPGDLLRCEVKLDQRIDSLFDFTAHLHHRDLRVMTHSFRLANIKSVLLHGHEFI